MFETIIKALENFCTHQLQESYTLDDTVSSDILFITYIDIDVSQEKSHRIYVSATQNMMQKVSKVFLEEDESDEETLTDMALETTNLIIGSAKVIAEDSHENTFTINTPHFIKKDYFSFEYDEIRTLYIENDAITIASKVLNA